MQGLLDFKDGCSLHPSFYCEAVQGRYKPFVSIEEASLVTISCINPFGKHIISCQHPYKQEFLEEAGGLSFNLNLKTNIDQLPSYIPVIDRNSKDIVIPDCFPVVGVSLIDIVKKGVREVAGRLHEEDTIELRTDFLKSRAFKDKKIILFLSGSDTLIEYLWQQRDNFFMFETIRNMGFWAATGINFSVMKGECSFAHALNLKRSLLSAKLIENNRVIGIPHVYAISAHQIDRWVKWFLQNPSVKLFTMNCQLQKSETDILQVIHTVKSILQRVPHVHILLQGFRINRLDLFGELIERIHVAEKKPIKYALGKRQIEINPSTGNLYEIPNSRKTFEELVKKNLLNRFQYYEQQKNYILQGMYQV